MKLFIKRHNQKKKSNKYIRVKRIEPSFEIDPNNPIIVNQDLFGLMIEIDRTLKAHYIPSISFISDVMSAKTKMDEIEVMIEALQTLQDSIKKSEV